MSNMFHGKVHGKIIELESLTGFEDGTDVTVSIQPLPEKVVTPSRGPGGWAGSLSQFPEMDAYLVEIENERKQKFAREIPE